MCQDSVYELTEPDGDRLNLTFKDQNSQIDAGQIQIQNLTLNCSVDPMKKPLPFGAMKWSESENVFRMDKSMDMDEDSNAVSLKISGNSDFEGCIKNGKSQVTLCRNGSECRAIETSRFEKVEDFWIFDSAKVDNFAVCCRNVSCRNEIGSVFIGQVENLNLDPEPVTEMVNKKKHQFKFKLFITL